MTLFGKRPPALEVQALRNLEATQRAISLAASGTDLTVENILDVHAVLMRDEPELAGRIRDSQNWIGGGALNGPLAARHVAPPTTRCVQRRIFPA
ncbi:hypothetical protein [Candidatus Poriferisodalis sp.]|uniref:hypothetical protein n=1 Tax=Candidatus Poriferisodalis sp. TaxID=3101277 RepID=UPI003B01DBEC